MTGYSDGSRADPAQAAGQADLQEAGRSCYVYMLNCADGSLYTGWTYDLQTRLERHNQGQGARYTRGRIPVRLVYWETCASKSEALKRELAIKRLKRAQKLDLIAGRQFGTGQGPLSSV